MIIDVSTPKYVHIEPGDVVELSVDGWWNLAHNTTVRRVVESKYHTYVVLDNNTWRPMSSYGVTWRKVKS